MRRLSTIVLGSIILLFLFTNIDSPSPASAKVCGEKGDNLQEAQEIEKDCEQKLQQLSGQHKTLSATLNYLNTQISLTQSKINKSQQELKTLEEEIASLTGRIDQLNLSLDGLSKLLRHRVRGTYMQSDPEPVYLFFSRSGFTEIINQYKYLKAVQNHDKKILLAMERSRANYDLQKSLKEQKQAEIEILTKTLQSQKTSLARQQQEKNQLLETTKNDESRYQQLLDDARKELQSLTASKFTNKQHVNKGETIGLMGNTGNSRGAHLHFGVYNNVNESNINNVGSWYYNNSRQPWDILQNKNLHFENKSCDDVVSGSLNKTIGNGSLPWPMDNPRITQCYGHTPWSYAYPDNFHRGIDMADSNNMLIKVVEEGEAYFYRGASSFGNNVRIIHPDGKMTLYLHMQ